MEFRDELDELIRTLRSLRSSLARESGAQVYKAGILQGVKKLARRWLDKFEIELKPYCAQNVIAQYRVEFTALLDLSLSQGNRRASYLKHLDAIIRTFNKDVILNVHTTPQTGNVSHAVLDAILSEIADPDESAYMREAIECAKNGYMRAAVVLGWCAGIERIHKRVEKIGFTKFNVISAQMASATAGRYKKFSKVQNVTSTSDLRTVFDADVLWIIEGMGLVDINQHTRLRSCFEMRNNSAHPGDAPITPYNLMSFFSDLNEILFKNKNFVV